MHYLNVKRSLVSSLLLYGAGCGSVTKNEDSIEPPINATSAGSVAEAGTLGLTGTLVSADADSEASKLVYTVATLPEFGALMRDGAALAVGDTFTQEEVNAGAVTYVNDGAEKTADSFTWTLSDGTNEIGPLPYAITVTPVNDAPVIVNNPVSTLVEGGTEILSDAKLSATDAETPSALTYEVVAISHGTMQQRVGTGVFMPIAVGATFTQQDIIDGNVKFIDSGVDDASLAAGQNTVASFSWRVTDSDGGVNPSATSSNVTSFTVTPVDDPAVVTWVPSRCHTPNTAINANPLTALADPDNANSSYQICVVSIGNATTITYATGATVGVTTSFAPTLKNGSTVLAVNSCVTANALSALTLQSTGTDYGGDVSWKLMKGSVQVGTAATMTFPVCP